jgi:hypothetical protein
LSIMGFIARAMRGSGLLTLYKTTQSGQHGHPKMSCMDLIHCKVGIYLDNCYWLTHIRYLYNT